MEQKNALISVYHKDGITEFAQFLIEHGHHIYASGGTSKYLTDAGIANTDVAELVGGGAILGHKVVTLSRELHAGLLADYDTELEELEKLGIPFIGLVCVDLYPLEDTINNPESTEKDVIAKTDIGGPTMISSAAKGGRLAICDPEDRKKVMNWMKNGMPEKHEFIKMLAAKADYVVAKYRLLSASYHSKGKYSGMIGEQHIELRYGENAPQAPAYLVKTDTNDPLALHNFTIHAGNPSMINLTDVDRALITMTRFAAVMDVNYGKVPSFIAIGVKHGNACGASFNDDLAKLAIIQMLNGNLKSIFGGVVVVNFMIDKIEAETLRFYPSNTGPRPLDVVVASSITDEAIDILKRKNDRCLIMTNPALEHLSKETLNHEILRRQVRGGWIQQPNCKFILDLNVGNTDLKWYNASSIFRSKGSKSKLDLNTLLAWAICATSNSNTITLVKDGMLIGNGVGQQDRVEAAELAIKRAINAGHSIKGAVAVSDSFFPYPDAPQILIEAGVSRIFATSGSMNDYMTIELFKDHHECELLHIPDKIARGFFGH